MRIISYNLWGRFGPYLERWPIAARELKKAKPDILCMQEAAHEPSLDLVAREAGMDILISDQGGTGLAVLSRLASRSNKLIEYKTRSPSENYIRKFQAVRIEDGKEKFLLLNTHLSWKAPDEASRVGQTAELAEYLKGEKLPRLLCGDFNCEYGSKPMEVLRKDYRDLMAGMPDETKPSWDNANPFIQAHNEKFADRRIDLILADAAFVKKHPLKKAFIAFKERDPKSGLHPSDHYGIIADFK